MLMHTSCPCAGAVSRGVLTSLLFPQLKLWKKKREFINCPVIIFAENPIEIKKKSQNFIFAGNPIKNEK